MENISGKNAEPHVNRTQATYTNKAHESHGKAYWHAEKENHNQDNNACDANDYGTNFLIL